MGSWTRIGDGALREGGARAAARLGAIGLGLLVSAGLLLASGAAHAAQITVSDNFGIVADGASDPVFLDGFDPSLGALQEVTWEISIPSAAVTFTTGPNLSPTGDPLPYPFTFEAELDVQSSDSDVAFLNPALSFGELTATGLGGPLPWITSASATASFPGGVVDSTSGFDSPVGALSGSLDDFRGGSITQWISYDVEVLATPQPVSPTQVSVPGTVTVTYDYVPVPEPGTAGLLALGLTALAAARERRA